jgi:hypothetical protein
MTTTTTRTFERDNNMYNCKLQLKDGTEFRIPLREDGYIHATEICKIASKKMHNWLRLQETMQLENELKKQNPDKVFIDVKKGGVYQGTWIHPDLAFNLIQWCSTEFSIQVSKWLFELVFTGNVELGNEKTSKETDEKYQELLHKLKETEQKLEETKDLVKTYDETNKELNKKYRQMHLNHQVYLRHKELYKLKTGPCIYIIDMKKTPDDTDIMRYKIGQTGDITNRVSGFRTSNPFCKVISVIYSARNIDLERSLKIKYEKQLFPINSEFVTGISKETIQEDILQIAEVLNIDYTIETEDELVKFNGHIITDNDVENLEELVATPDGFKRCGGQYHKTEESRQQPLTNFFKQKSNKDGHSRLCKECYSTGKYGENRRQRKVVDIPKYDTTSSKWCNVCESVKEHKEFYPDKTKKDGLNSNCISCRTDLKRKYKEQKQQQKEQDYPQPEVKQQIEAKNPLERFSKVELIHLCQEKGITVSIKKTKPEMIKMLS